MRLTARLTRPLLVAAALSCAMAPAPGSADVGGAHALTQFGSPKFAADFTHFPHANPDAPKGGQLTMAASGSFDSLNGTILRGVVPRTMGLTQVSLMTSSGWELGSVYASLAQSVRVADDLGSAVFSLRPGARWHDGEAITAGDLVFAWDTIQAHGNPFLKSFLDRVAGVEALDDQRLKVTTREPGKIKPFIDLAETLSPLPRHWWTTNGRDISKTTLEPPPGSGPYRVSAVDPGRSITYARVADWWGRDLPVNRGFHNFDTVKVEYYRDDDVMFEAFKAGAYDIRVENRAQRWVTGYDFPAVRDGRVAKRVVSSELPLGAQGFRFNTRRAKFADPRVREALGYLFDFEWIQKNILYGQYQRTKSNFPNSDYGASGLPGELELAVLEPYRHQLPRRLFSDAFEPPVSDGSGNNRANQREALRLLREAGWEPRNGALTNKISGEAMTIEFLDDSNSLTRVVQPYIDALRKVGIQAVQRVVDSAQYQARIDMFDFDVVIANFNFFPPPGTELRSYFGSAAADIQGSANYAGISETVADALIEKALVATRLEDVQAATRALDRVLLWSFYMVPHWYNPESWLVYKNRLGFPQTSPKYDIGFRNTHYPASWWALDGAAAGGGG